MQNRFFAFIKLFFWISRTTEGIHKVNIYIIVIIWQHQIEMQLFNFVSNI